MGIVQTSVDILVKCYKPTYASGEFKFSSFEELLHWLLTIKSLAMGQAGIWAYGLAKDGQVERSPGARADLEMNCSFHDYELAREVAITTGLLRLRGLTEIPSKCSDVALAFGRQLDGRIRVTSG